MKAQMDLISGKRRQQQQPGPPALDVLRPGLPEHRCVGACLRRTSKLLFSSLSIYDAQSMAPAAFFPVVGMTSSATTREGFADFDLLLPRSSIAPAGPRRSRR